MSNRRNNFSDGNKDPQLKFGKPGFGLDWDLIGAKYEQRLKAEREQGIDTPEHQLHLDMDAKDRELFLINQEEFRRKERARKARLDNLAKAREVSYGGAHPGGRPRIADPDEIVRLYSEERLRVARIAEKLKVSQQTVIKYLKRAGIYQPLRVPEESDQGKEVIRLYVEEKQRVSQIAEALGLGKSKVAGCLKRAGVYEPGRDLAYKGKRGAGTYKRQTVCKKGHDLTLPGSTRERFRKTKDGGQKKSGRECVECSRERNRRSGRWAKDKRNPYTKDGVRICLCQHAENLHFAMGGKCGRTSCGCLSFRIEDK